MLFNKYILIFIVFVQAFWPLGQKAVFAGSFYILENMDFGKLVASPGGGVVEFSIVLSKEELENPSTPYKGLLRLSGGKTGIIRYVPDAGKEQILFIGYPNDHFLDGEKKVRLRYMHRHSTTEVPPEEARPFFDIEIGGELHVNPQFRGKIEGSVPITIHINYE